MNFPVSLRNPTNPVRGQPLQRLQFVRLVGGGAVAAIAVANTAGLSDCAQGMPKEAIEAWDGPNAALAQNADVRRWLLSYAILAPHSHNLQSCVADLRTPGEITLYCNLKRTLPQTDPLSRQIMLSHGTFLELLDLAARECGLRADIALFPQGAFGPGKLDTRPVATVRLTPDATVQKDPLFGQILQRHTNRSSYDINRAVPTNAWAAMAAAAIHPVPQSAPVRVGFAGLEQGAAALEKHRRIASEARCIELTVPRTIMESFDVLRVDQSEIAAHRDGLSLNAGRAYARVQLAATAHGLAMQPLSQALQEYAEQQKPYADIHALVGATARGETVQMWARVGYAQPVEPAPRRRLHDFIRA